MTPGTSETCPHRGAWIKPATGICGACGIVVRATPPPAPSSSNDRWHRDVGPDESPIPKSGGGEVRVLREAVVAAHRAFRQGAASVDLEDLRTKLERALPFTSATPKEKP